MNFNTTNSTFRQLLGNGSTYRVPAFQRDYSWADDEWDDLWQDIVGLSEESGETSHYMGYLVPLERLPQRGLNSSEHQLRKAFNWFRERIKAHTGSAAESGRKLAAFIEMLADRLFFTVITVTDARPAEVISALREVYPDDHLFKAAFAEREFRTTNSRNRKLVRYILFEIERQRSGQDFDFESATYNLEHILPEHPSECWDSIEESRQERLIYRIGNLTPLETGKNRSVGNASYAVKRDAYRQSAFRITQAVAEHYETWDEQKIESRQSQLATVAASIWKIDFQYPPDLVRTCSGQIGSAAGVIPVPSLK